MSDEELLYQRIRSVIETEGDAGEAANLVYRLAERHYAIASATPRPGTVSFTAEELLRLMECRR